MPRVSPGTLFSSGPPIWRGGEDPGGSRAHGLGCLSLTREQSTQSEGPWQAGTAAVGIKGVFCDFKWPSYLE